MAAKEIIAESFDVFVSVNGAHVTVPVYGHGDTYGWRCADAMKTAQQFTEVNFPDSVVKVLGRQSAGSYFYAK